MCLKSKHFSLDILNWPAILLISMNGTVVCGRLFFGITSDKIYPIANENNFTRLNNSRLFARVDVISVLFFQERL